MKISLTLVTIFCATTAFAAHLQTSAVVQPISAAPQLLIPVAGSTPGANGTFFRSDIAMINFASHDQMVKLQWLPQGGGTVTSNTITISAQSGIRSADFVPNYLNQSGLGSILVTGVTSAGVADPTARLFISSRIWTPQPGTDGTTSQSLPAIPTSTINTPIAALFAAGGADKPENYRVNVGIVNLDPMNTQTFVITLPGQSGTVTAFTVTVPPMSMQQGSLGSNIPPTQEVLIQNVTGGSTQSNAWIAYGSTVDNITGDAWSELAVIGTTSP
jgi:hypothetical protein